MKQFLQGAACTFALILIIAAVSVASRAVLDAEGLELLITVMLFLGGGVMGYLCKRWNGPFLFGKDGKGTSRVFRFLLGVGIILGPVKLALGPFPIPDVIPLVNLLLIVLCVPLAGLSVFGPMLVGSWFYKEEPTWL